MMRLIVFSCTVVWSFVLAVTSSSDVLEPWNLPILAKTNRTESQMVETNDTLGKQIPRQLWMAFKDIPAVKNRSEHLNRMFEKNVALNWTLHLFDNVNQQYFMDQYFNNTSVQWAFNTIHPKLGVSKADIWRLCVLYMFGGLYMDDDSYFEASWDEIIHKNDTLIVGLEKNSYNDDCYKSDYRLSNTQMTLKYNNQTAANLFGGRILVSWALFAAPRHPVILRAMSNIVELVKLEYSRRSPLRRTDSTLKKIMCSTGPSMLTASAREVVMENTMININKTSSDPSSHLIKIYKRDFHEFGGIYKIHNPSTKHSHYTQTIGRERIPFLGVYSEITIEMLEGKLVTITGKEIFLVLNQTRHSFLDFDAFIELKYSLKQALRVNEKLMNAIKLSEWAINGTDNQYKCCFHMANFNY